MCAGVEFRDGASTLHMQLIAALAAVQQTVAHSLVKVRLALLTGQPLSVTDSLVNHCWWRYTREMAIRHICQWGLQVGPASCFLIGNAASPSQ